MTCQKLRNRLYFVYERIENIPLIYFYIQLIKSSITVTGYRKIRNTSINVRNTLDPHIARIKHRQVFAEKTI